MLTRLETPLGLGLALLFFSFLGGACQSTASAPILTEFADDYRIGLPVYGMSCPKCANNIVLQLTDIEGVESVDVNMGQGFVTVNAAEGKVPSRAVVVEAITSAGFSVPPKSRALKPGVNMPLIRQGPAKKQ